MMVELPAAGNLDCLEIRFPSVDCEFRIQVRQRLNSDLETETCIPDPPAIADPDPELALSILGPPAVADIDPW